MKEKFSKKLWIKFAKETLKGDNTVHLKPDLNKFGDLMEKVYNRNKGIESVLWTSVNPCGTEDRTWVRTFMYIEGYAEYSKMKRTLDSAHVLRIIEQFGEVINV